MRKRAGKTEDCLEIRLVEVLSDVSHEMGEAAGLEKDGVERDLQEELAAQPGVLGEELRLVRREWPTDIGPVDLMCRDAGDGWVAVEIKRIAGIEAVEQLTRYLERIRLDPARAGCRGVLAAQRFRPQALTLAESRGIRCVEVDLEVLRGEREPELTLFSCSRVVTAGFRTLSAAGGSARLSECATGGVRACAPGSPRALYAVWRRGHAHTPRLTCELGAHARRRQPGCDQETIGATICVRGWTRTIRPPSDYTSTLKVSRCASTGSAAARPATRRTI